MFRAAISLFAVIFVLVANVSNAAAERRVALVIGNSDYKHTSALRNPKHDANDLSVVLARMGFEVIDGTDLNKRDMERRIRDFSNALEGADVGLFFYAGHGLQVNGKNFLAPIDAELKSESDLDFEAVELNLVLRQMERNARINLVFLDACRDNPLAQVLARSLSSRGRSAAMGRGLARVEKAVGMMIAFATQPGNIALDGEGRNSPFTSALLKHIGTDGASINDVMIDVRNDVLESTDGKQVPWENSSLTGQFYFKPGDKAVQVAAADPAQTQTSTRATSSNADIDLAFWTSIRGSSNPALFEEYLRRFPDGAFTPIAKEKLNKTRAIDVEAATDKSAKTATKKTDEATVKTAELTPSATASDATKGDEPAIDTAAAKLQLAKDVQTALKKVGCYTSSIDGIWGPGSQRAMQSFNSVAKMSLSVGEPDETALTVIGAWRGKRCVTVVKKKTPRKTTSSRSAKKRPTQQRQQTTQRRQPPPQRDSGPPPGGGGPSTSVIIGGGRRNGGGLSIGIIGGGIRF